MASVSVIIPTYTNQEGLARLLKSFLKTNLPVIIIDNHPQNKKKIATLTKRRRNLIYLPQKKNQGFATAVNIGVRLVETPWLLILNDDVDLKKGRFLTQVQSSSRFSSERVIQFLVEYAKKNRLDAISPVLVNSQGEIENAGYQLLPWGKIKLIRNIDQQIENFDTIDGLTAACLLVKTKVFKELGGFDERFFAYLEDVEFFLRFKKSGYKFGVAPIMVLHHQQMTSRTMGLFKARQDLVNWWRLFFAHPDKFKLDHHFFLERVKNLSGLIKAILRKVFC
ncbi:MAG: glycosyltransferase [Patescibacteria group bacterium]|nr:glycosyltransferase [Patescibacteria group bacterium]